MTSHKEYSAKQIEKAHEVASQAIQPLVRRLETITTATNDEEWMPWIHRFIEGMQNTKSPGQLSGFVQAAAIAVDESATGVEVTVGEHTHTAQNICMQIIETYFYAFAQKLGIVQGEKQR